MIARTSSFSFRGKEQDIRRIAEALSVSNILEGSVRKAGNRIRVTAQLIDATDGSHIWSQRYDRDMTDIFAVQDEIAQAIAEKLRVRLAGERPLVKRYTGNVEAYNLYLKARYHLVKLAPENLAKSKEYFERAIAVDPAYAPAWQGLAAIYFFLGNLGTIPPKAANAQSRQAVLKALELDETLPEAHGHLAVLLASEYDWKGAEREFRRAMELGPEVWDVWVQYSTYYLVPMGRLGEAVAASRRALELDPLSPLLQAQLGLRYLALRQYNEALEQFRNALELDPHYLLACIHLGLAFIQVGRTDEGLRTIETAAQLFRHIPLFLGALGVAYACTGRISEAQRLLEELQGRAQKTYVPAISFAMIYSGLAEIDKAYEWIERSIEECHSGVSLFFRLPYFDALRSHPRYQALLRKMNLES